MLIFVAGMGGPPPPPPPPGNLPSRPPAGNRVNAPPVVAMPKTPHGLTASHSVMLTEM